MQKRTWMLVAAVGAVVGIGLAVVIVVWVRASLTKPPSPTTVTVFMDVDGSAGELERTVGQPLEGALANVKGLERLRVESRAGALEATCSFGANDGHAAAQSVRTALQGALRSLPRSVPEVRLDQQVGPVVVVSGAPELADALVRLNGVAGVATCTREMRPLVRLDAPRLAATSIALTDVLAALESFGDPMRTLSVQRPPPNIEALSNLALSDQVRLRDVAVVELGVADNSCLSASSDGNGGPAVHRISIQREADRREVERRVAEAITTRAAGTASLLTSERLLDVAFVVGGAPTLTERRHLTDLVARGFFKAISGRDPGMVIMESSGCGHVFTATDAESEPALRLAIIDALRKVPSVEYGGVVASPKGTPAHVRVTILGSEFDTIDTRAVALKSKVASVAGVGMFIGRAEVASPTTLTVVDAGKAAGLGVAPSDVMKTTKAALYGIDIGGTTVNVLGVIPDQSLPLLSVKSRTEGRVPLTAVAEWQYQRQRDPVVRVDRQRACELEWELSNVDAAKKIQELVKGEQVLVDVVPGSP